MKLSNAKQNIVRVIGDLKTDTTAHWGSFTVSTLIPHLSDTLKVALGKKNINESSPMPKWLMKWMVIYAPMPWPKGVKAPAVFFESAPTDIETDKVELLDLLDELIETQNIQTDHPMFGKMTYADWDHLMYRHFKHHFKQFGQDLL